ncbi:DUF4381 domain-containing protein [Alteromonas oceanisediminis]|uniref:DUF4381 domain-containing protein n=1 Tax=Alteromonas oceanisediminis TaxID=2836180 RepID=UPI001BD9186A|nr:DUF4381 domain-containing protein [Alteromonas oceanisediminis]MBT0587518.1 DUF4381 family protein [Alteromonas oceanisediminis]
MDPLAQLNDIQLTEPTGWWPLAWGWWVLIAAAISLCVVLLVYFRHQRLKNRVRRAALEALDRLASMPPSETSFMAINDILKRIAIHYYSPQTVAKLHGQHFQAFLRAQLPDKRRATFDQLLGDYYHALYAGNPPLENVSAQLAAAKLWCKHAKLDHARAVSEVQHA